MGDHLFELKILRGDIALDAVYRPGRLPQVEALDAAIAALEATHPQPVTPAGGEVVPVGKLIRPYPPGAGVILKAAHPIGATQIIPNENALSLPPGEWPLYTHPPVADAALMRIRQAVNAEWNTPLSSDTLKRIGKAIDAEGAALNQRGGGDHG